MLMARAVSLATGMATDHGRCWDLRPGQDHSAAGQARQRRGQDHRVEEHGTAGLSAANPAGRCADCRRLPCWNQHASCAPGAVSGLLRCGRQGYGEAGCGGR